MISLFRLQKLPRPQRLRKILKIFADAENRFLSSGGSVNFETEYYSEILGFLVRDLAKDKAFPPAALESIKTAGAELSSLKAQDPAEITRRPFNTIRHLLLAATGSSPADWDLVDSGGKLDPAQRRPFPGMTVYLEDIRSPFNVGAMFRTAESFGAEKIFLSPLCADPNHNRAKRSAMGCVDLLPWERGDFFTDVPKEFPLFALETGGLPLGKFHFPRRGIIAAGSEELGVSPRLLAAADASLGRVSIPCYGAKGSLNVSVAFGIVMQAWAERLAAGAVG